MNKKIPKIFVKYNKKINNNKEVYYSAKDDGKDIFEHEIYDEKTVRNIIYDIFSSKDFVYKKRIYIKTQDEEGEYNIVYKTPDYLLTIDNKKIYIKDIKYIENLWFSNKNTCNICIYMIILYQAQRSVFF